MSGTLPGLQVAACRLSSRGKRAPKFSWVLSYRGTGASLDLMTSPNPKHHPKDPPPDTTTLGIRASPYGSRGRSVPVSARQ